ncbi:MAG: ACT domain-containing protein [Clostridia bacterium]|nr:ACT domain-containing protein [Clostridia bacterium]
MNAIVSIVGKDRVGIIARISNEMADANANIIDISQTTRRGIFTMMMFVDVENITVAFDELVRRTEQAGKDLGVEIKMHREEIFDAMHRI